MNKFQKARELYKPDKINFLFLAESPPKEDSDRFFYFENVNKGDSLFLEIMKLLFPKDINKYDDLKEIRADKKKFLNKFKKAGYYLEDSLNFPIGVTGAKQKSKVINKHKDDLIQKLDDLIATGYLTKTTPILLISKPVYLALNSYLKNQDYNIINTDFVYFPGNGYQTCFHLQMKEYDFISK